MTATDIGERMAPPRADAAEAAALSGPTARAVVFEAPGQVSVQALGLTPPGPADVVVDIDASGVSTGTERLLWDGRMPAFPGMGYPLVPGYEAVGEIVEAGPESGRRVGERVFAPGARCYTGARGLFGGASARLVSAGDRVVPVDAALGDDAVLLALAATAYHAMAGSAGVAPSLIVGHGVLGRLLARLARRVGGAPPVVWETNPTRLDGQEAARFGYELRRPDDDERCDYALVFDVSGDASLLDTLIGRIAPGGEIVLAGFYDRPLSFGFPAAFMKEARLRVAAEWRPADLRAVTQLATEGRLSLSGLITHRRRPTDAADAYAAAFSDPACLKMILDWRNAA